MSLSNSGLVRTYAYAGEQQGAGFGRFVKAVKKGKFISQGLHALGDATNVFVPAVGGKIGELGDVAGKYGTGKRRKRH